MKNGTSDKFSSPDTGSLKTLSLVKGRHHF